MIPLDVERLLRALLSAGDWLLGRPCRHHWHPNLPPGGGDIYSAAYYTCCACPVRRRSRPADPGRRECTRYTP